MNVAENSSAMDPPSSAPRAAILQLITNVWASQAVATFARLSGPDYLATSALSTEVLASHMDVDSRALERLLRAVALAGIVCREGEDWSLTPLGQVLRNDVAGSMRAFLVAEMAPGHWLPWGRMDYSIRTGKPATHVALGMDYWSYCKNHPDEGRDFADAMTGLSAMAIDAVLEADDFSDARCVVDVGGSHGALLSAVLTRVPNARGVLFDLPHVVEGAITRLHDSPLASRIQFSAGSFFDRVPSGGDTYLLKHILHDWSDEECVVILANIRRVLPADGRLVVVEMILDDQGPPSPAPLLDLNMLVMLTGRERTLTEFETLFQHAGLRLVSRRSTASPYVLIEARLART